MRETKEIKNINKGITLIALVITIIVLLILAGVTVATITGENGLLSKAQLAKERTDESEQDEKDKLSVYESFLKNGGSLDASDREAQKSKLIDDFKIKAEGKAKSVLVDLDGENIESVKNNTKIFLILGNGEIIGYNENLPYTVYGLEKSKDYKISVVAIDKNADIKKCVDSIDVTTANYSISEPTNVNLVKVISCTADDYGQQNKPGNMIDGNMTSGNSLNWYGGTKCLIEYDGVCDLSAMAVYTTANWGETFSPATIYYSNDDSLTLTSDLSQFNKVTITTGSKQNLSEVISAKRVMLTKDYSGAVYEFECYGLY